MGVVRPAPVLLALLALLSAGCGEGTTGDGPDLVQAALSPATEGWTVRDGWIAGVAVELGEKLGGCAAGDVLPERPGDEIVVCGESGRVWVVYPDGGHWRSEVLGQAAGEMIQVATGDVLPGRAGDEVVAVGMASGGEDGGGEGAVVLLSRGAEGWTLEELHRSPALVHAVAVADLAPGGGVEIAVAGFARQVELLARTADGWQVTVLAGLDGAAKGLVPFRQGVAVVCNDGALLHVAPGEGGWTSTLVDQAPAGLARVATDDERLLAARDDGVLELMEEGRRLEVHREPDKLRGAVMANVDPGTSGIELATTGYGGRITVLSRDQEGWRPRQVWQDEQGLHHLTAARLPAVAPALALVACGYAGTVVVAAGVP